MGLIQLLTAELFLGGVILISKRSLKNSFSGVKITPRIEQLIKNDPKKGVILYLKFFSTFRVKATPKRVITTHARSKNNPILGVILTPDWELKELFFRI